MNTSNQTGVWAPRRATRHHWKPLVLAALVTLAYGGASAQPQASSMEDRLRAQLRITTAQLQQAQNELAVFKAGGATTAPAAAPLAVSAPEVAELKKSLARTEVQLNAEQKSRAQAAADNQQLRGEAKAIADKANAQVAQFRNAYDDLLKLARASEAERQRLAAESTVLQTAATQCEAKNAQLYAVGQEILRAYETVDVTTVLVSRQPFAAQSRAKYEQLAQQYGDKLYEGRFDARSVSAPAASQDASKPTSNSTVTQ